ncbi:hypothetical protein GCM10023192_45890 [Amycolatopsis samaneae]
MEAGVKPPFVAAGSPVAGRRGRAPPGPRVPDRGFPVGRGADAAGAAAERPAVVVAAESAAPGSFFSASAPLIGSSPADSSLDSGSADSSPEGSARPDAGSGGESFDGGRAREVIARDASKPGGKGCEAVPPGH